LIRQSWLVTLPAAPMRHATGQSLGIAPTWSTETLILAVLAAGIGGAMLGWTFGWGAGAASVVARGAAAGLASAAPHVLPRLLAAHGAEWGG